MIENLYIYSYSGTLGTAISDSCRTTSEEGKDATRTAARPPQEERQSGNMNTAQWMHLGPGASVWRDTRKRRLLVHDSMMV